MYTPKSKKSKLMYSGVPNKQKCTLIVGLPYCFEKTTQYTYILDSKTLVPKCCLVVALYFIPGLYWAEIECTVHVVLPKRTIN